MITQGAASDKVLPSHLVSALLKELDVFPFPWVDSRKRRRSAIRGDNICVSVGLGRNFFTQKYAVVNRFAGMASTQNILKLLSVYIKTPFTNIQINKNFPGKLHVDKHNRGLSSMVTVGHNCSGGQLWINGSTRETLNRCIVFNGNEAHMTLPYTGTRYSLIFFTHDHVMNSTPATLIQLKRLGFAVRKLPPTIKETNVLDKARDLAERQITQGKLSTKMKERLSSP